MKWLAFSCLLGLALVVDNAQAQMKGDRGSWQQPGTSGQGSRGPVATQPGVVHQTPRPEPSRAPSSAIHTMPGIVRRAPTAFGYSHVPVAQRQQNFVGGQREVRRYPHDGDFHQGDRAGDFRGRGFLGRHGHRSNFVIVYVNGVACWYPFYTAYPYYYDEPLAPTYDSGYYDSGASSAPYVDEGAGGGTVEVAPTYGDLGQEWAQDLRREVATWDDFVDYLGKYIIVAAPEAQAEFREAFIASYGINGAAAYDKAADQAAQSVSQGPKVINVSPAN